MSELNVKTTTQALRPTEHPSVGTTDKVPLARAEGRVLLTNNTQAKAIGLTHTLISGGHYKPILKPVGVGVYADRPSNDATWAREFEAPTQLEALVLAERWARGIEETIRTMHEERQISLNRWRVLCERMGVPYDLLPPDQDD